MYIQGDRATAAAESPRLITSGGSEAGIETPITITGGGSHSGHVVDSREPMQELIPLGRSIAVNSIWICFKEASPGCKTEGRAKDQ